MLEEDSSLYWYCYNATSIVQSREKKYALIDIHFACLNKIQNNSDVCILKNLAVQYIGNEFFKKSAGD